MGTMTSEAHRMRNVCMLVSWFNAKFELEFASPPQSHAYQARKWGAQEMSDRTRFARLSMGAVARLQRARSTSGEPALTAQLDPRHAGESAAPAFRRQQP